MLSQPLERIGQSFLAMLIPLPNLVLLKPFGAEKFAYAPQISGCTASSQRFFRLVEKLARYKEVVEVLA